MQAWQLIAHGAPEKALLLRELPDPVPASGQVLIDSEGFGLNYADVMAVKGLYRDAPPPPCVLGYETVGRIAQCGTGVPMDLLGKRVVAMTRFGGYAQKVVTDQQAVTVIPDEMPFGEAAALATQGCTAWYMARVVCPLRKGQRVLIHSAAGGVGQLLVQLAVHAGCEVFAVAAGSEKVAYLRSLGAKHAIDRNSADYAVQVRAILGTDGMDVSFNAVGGTTFKKDLALLGSGGALVLFGGAERSGGGSGFLGTLKFVWNMGLILPIFLMMKSKSLIGVNMLRMSERDPALVSECTRHMASAVSEGWLKPRVHHVHERTELPQAITALGSGSTLGKVVVRW